MSAVGALIVAGCTDTTPMAFDVRSSVADARADAKTPGEDARLSDGSVDDGSGIDADFSMDGPGIDSDSSMDGTAIDGVLFMDGPGMDGDSAADGPAPDQPTPDAPPPDISAPDVGPPDAPPVDSAPQPDIPSWPDGFPLPDGFVLPDLTPPDLGLWPDGVHAAFCAMLSNVYAATLPVAKACDTATQQCTVLVDDELPCPCPTFANATNAVALARLWVLRTTWYQQSCHIGQVCPAVLCPQPIDATCKNGPVGWTCRDNT